MEEADLVLHTDAGASIAGAGVHGPRQAGLGMHRDGTLLNCVVLLNHPSEFEGGGTSFAACTAWR